RSAARSARRAADGRTCRAAGARAESRPSYNFKDGSMATLYVGGRVFDGEKVLDGQAVLEEDGKVKRVASAGEFIGFSGDKVDTGGGTLIPGIIDCHVHSLSGA